MRQDPGRATALRLSAQAPGQRRASLKPGRQKVNSLLQPHVHSVPQSIPHPSKAMYSKLGPPTQAPGGAFPAFRAEAGDR